MGVQKGLQCPGQGTAHGGVVGQRHGPAGERVLHGKAGVAKGLHRHPGAAAHQHGGKAAPLRPAKAVHHPAQQGIHRRAGRQQPPGGKRQVKAQVRALGPGQQHRPAQQQVEQRIPPAQPGKAPPPRHAVGRSHGPAAGGRFVKHRQRPGQLRQQQAQRRQCRRPAARQQPRPGAAAPRQQPGPQQQRRPKGKVHQQQLVEIKHRFHAQASFGAQGGGLSVSVFGLEISVKRG